MSQTIISLTVVLLKTRLKSSIENQFQWRGAHHINIYCIFRGGIHNIVTAQPQPQPQPQPQHNKKVW